MIVLAAYPEAVVERVVHPLHGLPGRLNFLPKLAEIREACEAEAAEQQRHRETVGRWTRPQLTGPGAEPMPPRAAHATASALGARFGLRAIPPGWDAVDVTRAAARHGAELQAVIDRGLVDQGRTGGGMTAARSIVERAREAMEARDGKE